MNNSQKLTKKNCSEKLSNVLKRYLELIFEWWGQNCEPTSATKICKNQYSFLLRLVVMKKTIDCYFRDRCYCFYKFVVKYMTLLLLKSIE